MACSFDSFLLIKISLLQVHSIPVDPCLEAVPGGGFSDTGPAIPLAGILAFVVLFSADAYGTVAEGESR